MLGGYLGKVYVSKYGADKILRILVVIFTLASLSVFAASQLNLNSIWPILIPFSFIALANGAIYPIFVNRALGSAKQCPATAAGLQNSVQICFSGLASALVATMASHAQTVTGITIIICTIGLWVGYLFTQRSSDLPGSNTLAEES
jgi:hypothetical protein